MPGVRVRHRTHRNSVVLYPLMWRPTPRARECPTCAVTHPCKTYHLTLDDTGAVIVSTTVFGNLQAMGMPDLEVVNHVEKPPDAVIGFHAKNTVPWLYNANKPIVREPVVNTARSN